MRPRRRSQQACRRVTQLLTPQTTLTTTNKYSHVYILSMYISHCYRVSYTVVHGINTLDKDFRTYDVSLLSFFTLYSYQNFSFVHKYILMITCLAFFLRNTPFWPFPNAHQAVLTDTFQHILSNNNNILITSYYTSDNWYILTYLNIKFLPTNCFRLM